MNIDIDKLVKLAVAVIFALALAGAASSQSAVSREDFLADQEDHGWVRLGEFGRVWPAVPVREQTGEDFVVFRLSSGQAHGYRGYTGYSLKVVFLNAADGTETVVVLRSKTKRSE
jgi:hypothetical protein